MCESNDAARYSHYPPSFRFNTTQPRSASTGTRQFFRNFAPRALSFPVGSISVGNASSPRSVHPLRHGICGENTVLVIFQSGQGGGGTVRGPRCPQRQSRKSRRRWRRRQSNLEGTRVLFKTNAGSLLKYLLLLQNVLAGEGAGGAEGREENGASKPNLQTRATKTE